MVYGLFVDAIYKSGLAVIIGTMLMTLIPTMIENAPDMIANNTDDLYNRSPDHADLSHLRQLECRYNATVYINNRTADHVQMALLAEMTIPIRRHLRIMNLTNPILHDRYDAIVNESNTPLWTRSDGQKVYTIKDENRTKKYLGCA
jgi:hypothetical protein